MAYTLVHLADLENQTDASMIKDRGQSQFQKEIATAVSTGIMKLDDKNRFYPKKQVERTDAIFALDQVVQWMNDKKIEENKAEIEFDDSVIEIDEMEDIDEETQTATIKSSTPLKKDDVIHYEGENKEGCYRVEEVEPQMKQEETPTNQKDDQTSFKQEEQAPNDSTTKNEPKTHEEESESHAKVEQRVKLEPVQIEDVIQNLDLQGNFEVDFDQAEVIDDTSGAKIQIGANKFVKPQEMVVSQFKTFQKTIHGYTIKCTLSKSTIKAEILKEYDHGSKLFANAKIYSVRPSYHWNLKLGELKDSFFKVDFKTTESMGLRNGTYKHLYGDLSSIDPFDFEKTMENLFKEKEQLESVTIPIATFKVPLPNAPLFKLTMKLQVRVYASGRCELVLNQTHSTGFEVHNGMMRTINDHSQSNKTVIRADGSAITACTFGLDLNEFALADIGIETGTKFHTSSTMHFYDSKGNHIKKINDQIPADLIEEASHDIDDVLVCNDIKAYLFLDLRLNSPETMAARFGFTKQVPLLDETNGSLIPIIHAHAENWQLMDYCTRTDRIILDDSFEVPTSDRIEIKECSMIIPIRKTKQIVLTGLPKGYNRNDLVFTIDHPSVAHISSKGVVTGLKEGCTIVHIHTKDQLFTIDCNIKVR